MTAFHELAHNYAGTGSARQRSKKESAMKEKKRSGVKYHPTPILTTILHGQIREVAADHYLVQHVKLVRARYRRQRLQIRLISPNVQGIMLRLPRKASSQRGTPALIRSSALM